MARNSFPRIPRRLLTSCLDFSFCYIFEPKIAFFDKLVFWKTFLIWTSVRSLLWILAIFGGVKGPLIFNFSKPNLLTFDQIAVENVGGNFGITRFSASGGTLFFPTWVIELNTKIETKRPLRSGRLVSFLVFNSAFGRHDHWFKPGRINYCK